MGIADAIAALGEALAHVGGHAATALNEIIRIMTGL